VGQGAGIEPVGGDVVLTSSAGGRGWATARRQLSEKRRHGLDSHAVAVNEAVLQKQISRHLERAQQRHHQLGQLPRYIPVVDHSAEI
jgi:hypothetical protein